MVFNDILIQSTERLFSAKQITTLNHVYLIQVQSKVE
jgi:hypothetical protein